MNDLPKILIVDDTSMNISVVANILKNENYALAYATGGHQAITLMMETAYTVILLDVMMPEIDGYQVCKTIRAEGKNKSTPIIFLTAKTDKTSIIKGFESGGHDYVTKPFHSAELLARVRTLVKLKTYEDGQQNLIDDALIELQKLNNEIVSTQREVVLTMGAIAETRSKETGQHVKRVAEFSKLFATLIGMPTEEIEIFKMASPMHDIGKVGIPDHILNKQGALTNDEWEIMKTHAQLGYDMLCFSEKAILKVASCVALEHHEKWDGSGYPQGLSGTDIHIYGRITAIADVFDALCSKRCYKESWDDIRIFELLKKQRGKHFDPELIDLFFDNLSDFLDIRSQYIDVQ